MSASIFPRVNQKAMVNLIKTPYATGVLKLFKSQIALADTLDAAALAAVECDFSGYAAITLISLPAAYYDSINGGVSFTIPTQQWDRTLGTPDVGNPVWGGWIENAGGDLLMAWEMDAPYGMNNVGNSLPLELTLNFFGTNEVYAIVNGTPR